MLSDPNAPGTGHNLDRESLPLRSTPVSQEGPACLCLSGGRQKRELQLIENILHNWS